MTAPVQNAQQVEEALATVCPGCGEPVLRTVTASDNRLVRLEPTPTVGGLYQLVQRGDTMKAQRRNVYHMFQEYQAGRAFHGGGYEKHRCATAPAPAG